MYYAIVDEVSEGPFCTEYRFREYLLRWGRKTGPVALSRGSTPFSWGRQIGGPFSYAFGRKMENIDEYTEWKGMMKREGHNNGISNKKENTG